VSSSPRSNPSTERQLLKAMRQLETALAAKPDEPGLLVLRARAAARLDGPAEAARWWQKAARAQEGAQAADSHREAAQALEEAGDLAGARQAWEQMVRVEPTATRRLAAVAFLRRSGDTSAAAELLENVARSEEHAAALDACDQLCNLCDDPMPWARRAVEHAAKAKQPDDFGRCLVRLAQLHHDRGDDRKAAAYLERARPYVDESKWPAPLAAMAG